MLAQNFKSAADLGIEEVELSALISVLYMLEREEVVLKFRSDGKQNAIHMDNYLAGDDTECGTTGCIIGWAHKLSGRIAFPELRGSHWDATSKFERRLTREACDLFYIDNNRSHPDRVDQIAAALRSWMTTGNARWDLALA